MVRLELGFRIILSLLAEKDSFTNFVVIADIHGDWQALWRLLLTLDAIDQKGQRNPDYHLLQIGDLCDLGVSVTAGDSIALLMASLWMDEMLLGNHEAASIYKLTSFAGQRSDKELDPLTLKLIEKERKQNRWKAASTYEGWVISHAGIHPAYQSRFDNCPTPERLVSRVNRLFKARIATKRRDLLFDSIGPYRGKERNPGGIFWMDSREMVRDQERNDIRQIVGHTSHRMPELLFPDFWTTDVGCGRTGQAAALVHRDNQDWLGVQLTVRPPAQVAPRLGTIEELLSLDSQLEVILAPHIKKYLKA